MINLCISFSLPSGKFYPHAPEQAPSQLGQLRSGLRTTAGQTRRGIFLNEDAERREHILTLCGRLPHSDGSGCTNRPNCGSSTESGWNTQCSQQLSESWAAGELPNSLSPHFSFSPFMNIFSPSQQTMNIFSQSKHTLHSLAGHAIIRISAISRRYTHAYDGRKILDTQGNCENLSCDRGDCQKVDPRGATRRRPIREQYSGFRRSLTKVSGAEQRQEIKKAENTQPNSYSSQGAMKVFQATHRSLGSPCLVSIVHDETPFHQGPVERGSREGMTS